MNHKFLLSILATGHFLTGFGQSTLELSYTATYDGQYVQLDSILIENLTQGGDTTLVWPDTTLLLDYSLGIDGPGSEEITFSVSQNYPNPFAGQTTIHLKLPEPEFIEVSIRDIYGRELHKYESYLVRGNHSFTIHAGGEQYYLLRVTGEKAGRTLKMVSLPDAGRQGGRCKIVHNGNTGYTGGFKSLDATNGFGFVPGDALRHTGFAKTLYEVSGSDVIEDTPQSSENYTFNIKEGLACPGMPSVTYEGQTYSTVQIGGQCWFRENLNVGTFVESVLTGFSHSDVSNNGIIEKYCAGNDEENCDIYGGLYDWDEMMGYTTTAGAQGICPEGWHIPTDVEWCILSKFIDPSVACQPQVNGTLIAGKMKEPGTAHWGQTSADVTNESGFTALGGGNRHNTGTFELFKERSPFWTSNQVDDEKSWRYSLASAEAGILRGTLLKTWGFSVRCLKDETSGSVPTVQTGIISEVTAVSATFEGEILDSGGSDITQHGHCWSTGPNPTIDDPRTELGAGSTGSFTSNLSDLEPDTTYYVRAYATNNYGTAYGSEATFETDELYFYCPPTVTDIDGNIYHTAAIGEQCWMAENLKTTTYKNGIPIPNDTTDWMFMTTAAYVWYDNDSSWKDLYGAIYNWYAVDSPNGLCPEGWHAPSYDEWTALTVSIGGTGWPHGNELKSCRQVNTPLGGDCNTTEHPRWDESNENGTDDFGFSALAGGWRVNNSFSQLGKDANWWTSTGIVTIAGVYNLNYNYGDILGYYTNKDYGNAVRCVRD